MSEALRCDICGKFYAKNDCLHMLKINKRMGSGNYYSVFEGDICDQCLDKLTVTLVGMGCKNSYVNKLAEAHLRKEVADADL